MRVSDKPVLTPFNAFDSSLFQARKRAKHICQQINALRADQTKARNLLYQQLFQQVSRAYIEPDFFCDYGDRIILGNNFYANHHCVLLDGGNITIGDNVMLGPNVHIYSTSHPIDAAQRQQDIMLAAPVALGNNCWIGGNSVIMPGVTIGESCVIGAGSVVTRSIPAGHIAAGNPCRVLRPVTPDETIESATNPASL